MKSFSNILATIIVALFLLSFGTKSEAVGQPCTSMLDTLIIEGCPYVVEICVYCGVSYPGYVRVDNVEPIDPNCSSGLTQPELIQRVIAELNTPTALWLA